MRARNRVRRLLWNLAAIPALVLLPLGVWTGFSYRFPGAGTWEYPTLAEGALWSQCVIHHAGERLPMQDTPLKRRTLEYWSNQPIDKTRLPAAPRALLARLALGREIPETNAFLRAMQPWAATGSEWDLREAVGFRKSDRDRLRIGHRGDYDFAMVTFVTCLYLFADEPTRLYPETASHLANHLLIEKGGVHQIRLAAPLSLGRVAESENHILMTESCRYLTNQWLCAHGERSPEFDNAANGLEEWLVTHLTTLRDGGLHEFNSRPYLRLTLEALLNLQAFAANDQVRIRARELVDAANWSFALGSMDFRRNAPFRRQTSRAADTSLYADHQSAMMAIWTSHIPSPEKESKIVTSPAALPATLIPYTLPSAIINVPEQEAFVRIGRGPSASPEIYSRAPGFGLMALIPQSDDPQDSLKALAAANGDEKVRREFHFPDLRTVTYDVDAAMGIPVIHDDSSGNDDRVWANWPRMDGWIATAGAYQSPLQFPRRHGDELDLPAAPDAQ